MSIIHRENPLNLQYNVCIVTRVSSALGIRIAKALLKANALVLGIDSQSPPRDMLNAALGTHFQFEEWNDRVDAHGIVKAVNEKFGLERLDVLVNVDGGVGMDELAEETIEKMKEQGKGCVICVGEDVDVETVDDGLLAFTKGLVTKYQSDGIRCNVILPQASGGGDMDSARLFGDAREHMNELRQSKADTSKAHDVGLLVGWLASDLGESVAGRIVRLDGSSSPI